VQSAVVVGHGGCAADRLLGPVRSAFAWCRASTDSVQDYGQIWLAVLRQAPVRSMVLWRCYASNDITPFWVVVTILLLWSRRQITTFAVPTTITPSDVRRQLLLGCRAGI